MPTTEAELLAVLPKLVRAALNGDYRRVENLATTLVRKLRNDHPDVAQAIGSSLSQYLAGATPYRSVGLLQPPVDDDSRLALVEIREPAELQPPILHEEENVVLQRFMGQWQARDELIRSGIRPATTLLLQGLPGVGKTYTANYMASVLALPMIILDLSTALSSYLGKSGQNLRSVLDYARSSPSLLLLDEFDAIAKKRDDPTDLGELKRIVSVLLQELEEWPSHGVVIAATNHPELVDRAMFRRFDYVLEVRLPGAMQRKVLLEQRLTQLEEGQVSKVIAAVAEVSEGFSAADICKLSDRALRRSVLESGDLARTLFEELLSMLGDQTSKMRGRFVRSIREILGDSVSIREIAGWLKVSPSTVHYHLTSAKE